MMYCPLCREDPSFELEFEKDDPRMLAITVPGATLSRGNIKCPCMFHGDVDYVETNISDDEYRILMYISTDWNFFDQMSELKEKDPIEFASKMAQFKIQAAQMEEYLDKKYPDPYLDDPVLRCPKCNSTSITTGARGVNHFWGRVGASKTVNRCGNCGHTWKPRR